MLAQSFMKGLILNLVGKDVRDITIQQKGEAKEKFYHGIE